MNGRIENLLVRRGPLVAHKIRNMFEDLVVETVRTIMKVFMVGGFTFCMVGHAEDQDDGGD